MLLSRSGVPQEEELVLCTVTSVQYHSVFVTLDEFSKKTGMIHISEVAPGRIRNIREFVSEGKKVVCKVLAVSGDRIDLSLRRVNESQKRTKNDQIRREQQAEKILEYFAEQQKLALPELYKEISRVFFDASKQSHYGYLADVFDDVVNKGLDLAKQGLKAQFAQPLTELIKSRIKPPEVQIEGTLKLETYAPQGVETIKSVLAETLEKNPGMTITYVGGGAYSMRVKANDYRAAEKVLKNATDGILATSKKNKLSAEFIRERE